MILKDLNTKTIIMDKLLILYLSIIVLLFAAWFLYQYGIYSHDYGEYEKIWHYTNGVSFSDAYLNARYEIGSYFLFWNLSQVTSAAQTFYIFGLISLSSKFYLIKRNYNYPLVSFSLYMIIFVPILDANQIRAALAMTILMYSLCIKSNNIFTYLVLAGIAVLFHFSGIIILILYLVRFPLLGLIGLIVFSFSVQILISSFSYLAFAEYWLASPSGKANLTSSIFILQAGIFFVSIYFWKKLSYLQQKGAYLNAFGVLIYVLFIDYDIVAHRIRELSQIGIMSILFFGEKKWTYIKLFSALCISYIAIYNLIYIFGRLA